MALTEQWTTPETITSALTTELNALANGSLSAASGVIDNLTGLYTFIELELVLSSLTPTTGAYLLVHANKQIDGTNYEDLSTANVFDVIWTFTPSTSASAKRLIGVAPIWPAAFKLAIENQAGVALGSTSSTLKYRRFNRQTV